MVDALPGAGSVTPATETTTPTPAPATELKDPRLDVWNTPTDDEIAAYEAQEAKKAKKPGAADTGEPPAVKEATADPGDDGDDDADPAEATLKRLQRAHARGDRLHRERNEARAQGRQLKAQLDAARAEIQRVQGLINKPVDVEAMDYEAREQHRIDQRLLQHRKSNAEAHAAHLERSARDTEVRAAQEQDIEIATQLQNAVEKDAERYPGLWDKLLEVQKDAGGKEMKDRQGNPVPVVAISPTMMRFIQRSSVSVPLLHALAGNPQLAAQIHDLDQMGQVAAIAELSGRIQAANRRTVSNTPNPGTRLRGGRAPETLSMDALAEKGGAEGDAAATKEYLKRRQEQWAKGMK